MRRNESLGRLPALDGIRAIAVLLVMGYHAGLGGFSGGQAGVDVFFVLSGFLITTLLLQERRVTLGIRLGAFYMRRVLRLYPALIAAVILAIALAALKVPVFGATFASFRATSKAVPFALLYTMNVARATGWSSGGFLGHTWSLAIEEQFYLVWPIVVIAVMRRRGRASTLGWIALTCAIASALIRAALQARGFDPEMLYNATFSHVDGIFAGSALGVLWSCRPDLIRRLARPALVASAIAIALVVIVRGRSMNTYGFATVVIATVVVVSNLVTRRDAQLARMMGHPLLTAIGRRSYGLYLYHWPIFLFIGIHTRRILLLGFGLSFAAAWISYALIEQPFLRLKRRWAIPTDSLAARATEPNPIP